MSNAGRQEVAYIREAELVEAYVRGYRGTERKRKWVRVGLLCLDCMRFKPDKRVDQSPATGLSTAAAAGRPKSAIGADGIPTGS